MFASYGFRVAGIHQQKIWFRLDGVWRWLDSRYLDEGGAA